ncbi:cyanophycinase [Fastidiosibacter lacustris]|uniref:cyanophycinase n=1 Tax=Fastidiosibacter lacustris TaxID=2056695 RepID=UPI000E34D805|nr:cyanophycinase [Fastidiosibacter lacustris]
MPAPTVSGIHRGYIIPIGGREDKFTSSKVLTRFIELSGGEDAYIVIIPTASKLLDTGSEYVKIFNNLGVKNAISLEIQNRADTYKEAYLAHFEKATGIFMTGGNQLLLSTILGGTKVAQLIRRCNAKGVHVAGTSAGAAFISEHMIVGGANGFMPRYNMVNMAPGLGLTNKILVDQHFSQRDRLGRLLTALSYNPFVTGVGIDEDTGAFLAHDGVIEVVGSGALTIIDMSHIEHSSMPDARDNDPISLVGIRMHLLLEGSKYDANVHEVRVI